MTRTTAASATADQAGIPSRRVPRQLIAVIWILIAWITGIVVFELTAIGGEMDNIRPRVQQDFF